MLIRTSLSIKDFPQLNSVYSNVLVRQMERERETEKKKYILAGLFAKMVAHLSLHIQM